MNPSTSTELRASDAGGNGAHGESRMLCAITLGCYATTLGIMLVFGHTLLMLVQGAAAQHIVNLYLPAVV